jgi:hypothetical protein
MARQMRLAVGVKFGFLCGDAAVGAMDVQHGRAPGRQMGGFRPILEG